MKQKLFILSIILVLPMIGCKPDPLPGKVAELERQIAQLKAAQVELKQSDEKLLKNSEERMKELLKINEIAQQLLEKANKPKPATVVMGSPSCVSYVNDIGIPHIECRYPDGSTTDSMR